MRPATGERSPAICDRCGFKRPYREMQTEHDTKLRVCPSCLDEPDPYLNRPGLLTPRISGPLKHARPDPADYTDE